MDYPIMEPPFDVKPFDKMSEKEAQVHFNWYINQIPLRIDLLKNAFEATGGGLVIELDLSPDSLKILWRWFLQYVNFIEKPQSQIREEIANMPDWLGKLGVTSKRPSRDTLVLAMDVSIYFGETIINRFDKVHWGLLTKPKNLAHVNKPVLIGFKNTQLDPSSIVINSLKKNNPDALYELFKIWTEGMESQ